MITLEFALPPAAAARLWRLRPAGWSRRDRARKRRLRIIWHDSADCALAGSGRVLAEQDGRWRLEQLGPGGEPPWPPGAPSPVLAEADEPGSLDAHLPAALLPCAAFEGRETRLTLRRDGDGAELALSLIEGAVRGLTRAQECCRLQLSGPGGAALALALDLAGPLDLAVPAHGLAAEGLALARGIRLPDPPLGAAPVQPEQSVPAAFAGIAGHLARVLLHWAPAAAQDQGPEPVHQMRVALRRLRAALAVFGETAAGTDLAALKAALSGLNRVLGPARDWDVFATGLAARVAESFPEEPAIAWLIAATERRRLACYAALRAELTGEAFRALGVRLALLAAAPSLPPPADLPLAEPAIAGSAGEAALPPGASPAPPPEAGEAGPETPGRAAARTPQGAKRKLGPFAARALDKRLKKVLQAPADLADLPPEALHELRLAGKRLRYAAEFFAPLHPGRATERFLRRLAALQERLGHVNDAAVAAGLLAQLPGRDARHALAIGIVRGFAAARHRDGHKTLSETWRKFRKLEPFWA